MQTIYFYGCDVDTVRANRSAMYFGQASNVLEDLPKSRVDLTIKVPVTSHWYRLPTLGELSDDSRIW